MTTKITPETVLKIRVNREAVLQSPEDKARVTDATPIPGKTYGPAAVYHGPKSANWKPESATAAGVVSLLKRGYGVAASEFSSGRSAQTFIRTGMVLFDADEWSDACPPPCSVDDLLRRFPDLPEDAFFLSESLSSRTKEKPEWRFRLGVLLPEFLDNSDEDKETFGELVKDICEKYPFLAIPDIARSGFGNARAGAFHKIFGGQITPERLAAARAQAQAAREKKEREEVERAAAAAARAAAKPTKGKVSDDNSEYAADDPLKVFRATPIRDLLFSIGCQSIGEQGGTESWSYPGLSNPKSFDLYPNGGLSFFSTSEKIPFPPGAGRVGINGHRFVLYHRFGFDFVDAAGEEREKMLSALAAAGYGTYEKKPPRTQSRRLLSLWETSPNAGPKIKDVDLPAVQALRKELCEHFRNWMGADAGGKKRFLLLSYDTGAGKSTAVILNSETLLMISPHWELAAGNAAVSEDKGRKVLGAGAKPDEVERWVFLWQGKTAGFNAAARDLGFDPDGEIKTDVETRQRFAARFGQVQNDGRTLQCAFGDLVNRYHRAGYEFGTSFCPSCPFREECQGKGYHSQRGRAQKAKHVHVAWADIVFDPAMKTFAGLAKTKDLAVVDDLPIVDMIIRRAVSLPLLDRLISERDESWTSDTGLDFKPDTGAQGGVLSFLKKLRWLLTTDGGPGDVKSVLETFSKETLQTARRELSKIPFYFSVSADGILDHKRNLTLSKKEFPELHEWLLKREKTREDAGLSFLKKIQKVDLTPARAIRLRLVNRYKDLPMVVDKARGFLAAMLDATARVRKVNLPIGERMLEISVKPTLNFRNTVFLSATANPEQVQRMLRPGVDFSHEKGPAARWRAGCQVFQINTGLYTGESWFRKPFGRSVSGAGPRLKDVVAAVLRETRRGKKVLVVGRKALKSPEVKTVMGPILENPAVAIANYGAIDGLNDFSDFDTCFLFLPYPDRGELEDRAAAVLREEFDELDFETREQVQVAGAGVTLKMNSYADPRVSELAVSLMREQIYQAAMRLRPNSNPDKAIVVLTALPIPGLTDRDGTVGISFHDLRKVGEVRELSLLNLPDETVSADLAAGKTIKEIATARGVSERAVWNATRAARAVEKKERDDEILARHAAGESLREIARAVGISKSAVDKVLKS